MAEKRMFTKKVIDSDEFVDMPLSTQCLYFHLNMNADDDGFVNNPKRIMRAIGASDDDLKILIAKQFVLVYETGVLVIRHWRLHNTLKSDRYHPTEYQEEYQQLGLNGKIYTWNQNGTKLEPQYRIDKNNIEKNKIEEDSIVEIISPAEQDRIPYSEIIEYLNERIGSNYKHTTNKTKDCIKARYNEGFTIEDFKEVIDKKANEWLGTEMQKFLRPETLFGNKFEGYLNQQAVQKKIGFKEAGDLMNWEEMYDV